MTRVHTILAVEIEFDVGCHIAFGGECLVTSREMTTREAMEGAKGRYDHTKDRWYQIEPLDADLYSLVTTRQDIAFGVWDSSVR